MRELVPIVISNKVLVSSVNKPLMPGLVDQINSCSFCHEHYTCEEAIWPVHLQILKIGFKKEILVEGRSTRSDSSDRSTNS